MVSLEKKVSSNEIINQQQLEEIYSQNINELSTQVNTNITVFGVIEDYKKAISLLSQKGISIENHFNRNIFTQILAKIKAIGLANWKESLPEFKLYRNYLITEVSKRNFETAQSFKTMFSDEYIKLTSKDILNLFYVAFSNYVEIAVNLHQYRKATITQNSRISNSCFEELSSKYNSGQTKIHIKNIQTFFNELIEEILNENQYKK